MLEEKVLIIGNSKKFIKSFKEALNCKNPHIVSWRSLMNLNLNSEEYTTVILCGYHHESYAQSYDSYVLNNIIHPLNFMRDFDINNTKVIYINTSNPTQNYTTSRYCYAKHTLAIELNNKFNKFLSIDIPILINTNGSVEFYSNFLEKLFAKIIIKSKNYEILKLNDLSCFLRKKILENKHYNIKSIDGKHLHIRRTRFIDKIARLIFA